MAVVADRLRWVWAVFGALFGVSAIICFINPENTFVALADVLGFLFLCVGIWWTIRAFLLKAVESTWWIELVAGVLMLAMAFWPSGQFFVEKAYMLLVFAGIWALVHGITDIVVVTHGWHMARAERAFADVARRQPNAPRIVPAPMGLARHTETELLRWLPTADGMAQVRTVLREALGLFMGS